MDLSKISKRIDSGFYRTKEIYISDFKRMFENCKYFNDPKSEYYECAQKLEENFKNLIRKNFY